AELGYYFSVDDAGRMVVQRHRNYTWLARVATFDENGNIGIGTPTPAYKLDVNGTARVTELRIGDATLSWDAARGCIVANKTIVTAGDLTAKD
ncbi:MAG: hypothetical protein K2J06_01505, partial [Muribaculaceae bacterium]|nr:hypothetical protein [Muribaculaceae bacterium]